MAANDLRYRLLAEGKDLPAWHPLLTGSKAAMHGERILCVISQ